MQADSKTVASRRSKNSKIQQEVVYTLSRFQLGTVCICSKGFMFINQICKVLQNAKIPYAIVGGYAVALHGAPRGTFDVDFVIQWSLENLQKTEMVLKSLGLVSRLPIDAEMLFHFRDEYVTKRHLITWNFYDPLKPSHQVDIVITFDLKKAKTKTIKSLGGDIKILSIKDLIKMKRASGRAQDLEDIQALEQL